MKLVEAVQRHLLDGGLQERDRVETPRAVEHQRPRCDRDGGRGGHPGRETIAAGQVVPGQRAAGRDMPDADLLRLDRRALRGDDLRGDAALRP